MSLYSYAVLMQAATADFTIYVPLIAVAAAMLGTYTFFVKRMTDTHFASLEGMRVQLADQDHKLSKADRQVATLEERLRQTMKDAAQEKYELGLRIKSLEESRQQLERDKATKEADLQQQINGLGKQLADLTTKYDMVVSERVALQVELREAGLARANLQMELEQERTSRQQFESELRDNHKLVAGMQRKIKALEEKAGIQTPNGDDDDPPPGTEPNGALPPAPPPSTDADGAADKAMIDFPEKKGNGSEALPSTGTDG